MQGTLKGCLTLGCVNGTSKGRYCYKCVKAKWRKKNPILDAFCNVRSRAKRDNISFTMTLLWFTNLCKETKYIELKGLMPESMSLDRIEANLGYSDGNVRVISMEENGIKGNEERKELWDTYYKFRVDNVIVDSALLVVTNQVTQPTLNDQGFPSNW